MAVHVDRMGYRKSFGDDNVKPFVGVGETDEIAGVAEAGG
jgi:hypothetical protein